jgi:citronellol/citronellal dehydrogenase
MATDNASAPLRGKTLFISGGSRGVGLAIARRVAQDGANIALVAKTDEAHPKLPGTVHTAAKEIEEAGGQALPIVGDIRDAEGVSDAVEQAVEEFGSVDIVVNNASAIDLSGTEELEVKSYDLMQNINARGTFVVTKACLPHLKKSDKNPHVLTLSPPLNLDPQWLAAHVGYTISKYNMSMLTLGWAEEFREDGIAFNSLWPRTMIATAAVMNLLGGEEAMARSRNPEILADAAHAILSRPSREYTGNFFIDEEVLAEEGIIDLERYRADSEGGELAIDLFLD